MMELKLKIYSGKIFEKKTLLTALWVGILATFIEFLLNFFGIDILFGILPGGFKLLVVVGLSVLLSKILIITYKGKEVI